MKKIRLVHPKRTVALAAHRGASAVAPENTLAAVQKALDSPADYIEVDVHQTLDAQLVLMHDATLNRTTTGEGDLSTVSLAQLKELDAGSWFHPAFKNERVPTLEEVLQLVQGRKKLLIELKKGREMRSQIGHRAVALIQKYAAREWCVIQSFHDELLEQVWQHAYPVTTHKLIVGKVPLLPVYFDTALRLGSFAKYHRVAAINVNQAFATRGFVNHVHHAGFQTFVWTVDDPAAINRFINRGVDGIISNNVAALAVE